MITWVGMTRKVIEKRLFAAARQQPVATQDRRQERDALMIFDVTTAVHWKALVTDEDVQTIRTQKHQVNTYPKINAFLSFASYQNPKTTKNK